MIVPNTCTVHGRYNNRVMVDINWKFNLPYYAANNYVSSTLYMYMYVTMTYHCYMCNMYMYTVHVLVASPTACKLYMYMYMYMYIQTTGHAGNKKLVVTHLHGAQNRAMAVIHARPSTECMYNTQSVYFQEVVLP